METWILFVIIYALLVGIFECSKKKATEKNSIYEVLAIFSTMAFIMAALTCKEVFDLHYLFVIAIFIKSLAIAISWVLGLYAIKRMSVSLYGIINLSRIVFSILMSCLLLGETITVTTIIGMIIVVLGLMLVNKATNSEENKETSLKTIIILLVSCSLSAIAGIIDKVILSHITGSQMQFWFVLFLMILCWIIFFIKNKKKTLKFNKIIKNYWLIVTAASLIIADKFLFEANRVTESRVSVMTIIKQLSTIEMIILGKFMFKEKNIVKKLLCSLLIIFGIVLTII